jgi:glycosyltransferase involved in cell wall biosynthesis
VAGAFTDADIAYVCGLKDKLKKAGLIERVSFEPNITFEEKAKFLHEITVFSVPATYGEAFGLYVAEAQACGVPVVQPRHGAFPEVLAVTQGGIMVAPDDTQALAQGLEELLLDTKKREQLSTFGKFQARAAFSASRMAERFENVLKAK